MSHADVPGGPVAPKTPSQAVSGPLQPHPLTSVMQMAITFCSLCIATAAITYAIKTSSEERNARLVEIGVGVLRVDPTKMSRLLRLENGRLILSMRTLAELSSLMKPAKVYFNDALSGSRRYLVALLGAAGTRPSTQRLAATISIENALQRRDSEFQDFKLIPSGPKASDRARRR
jgi:hypothetical protein